MSILIKGMEMPGRCGSCPCLHAEHPIHCQAVKADRSKRITAPYGLPRPDWCPLIEVPPHGRLIDADAYEKLLQGLGNRDYRREKGTICDAVKFLHSHYTPTVIEAETCKSEDKSKTNSRQEKQHGNNRKE
ncbi:MAG: hypothetical protein IJS22_03375 [Lachnospiraceae bacterium]|nr:hypothetical protein [Lachnospiraceae bacterium]